MAEGKAVVTATLSVRNWERAMEFYKAAFGATETYRVPGGGVGELDVRGARFWVAEESPENLNFSPETLGGCSVRMLLMVDDPTAMCAGGGGWRDASCARGVGAWLGVGADCGSVWASLGDWAGDGELGRRLPARESPLPYPPRSSGREPEKWLSGMRCSGS